MNVAKFHLNRKKKIGARCTLMINCTVNDHCVFLAAYVLCASTLYKWDACKKDMAQDEAAVIGIFRFCQVVLTALKEAHTETNRCM